MSSWFSDRYSQNMIVMIQGLREGRGLKRSEVAQDMELNPRTYDRFEDGQGHFEPDRIFRFSEITDADPCSILVSLVNNQPEFALRTADNKFGLIMFAMMQHMNDELGDDLSLIDSTRLITLANKIVAETKQYILNRDVLAEEWLAHRAQKMNFKLTLSSLRRWFKRKPFG